MKKILVLLLSLGLLISSCASKKNVKKPVSEPISKPIVGNKDPKVLVVDKKGKTTVIETKKNYSTLEYINTYSDIAKSEMKSHKIPASITIAQGILESNNGNSVLTLKSNNHFGIKCHRGWRGEKVYHDDDEKGECFRSYSDPATSFKDHSAFLSGRKRYAGLFELEQNDYKSWAKGLRQAGYATDKKYPEKLIRIIEKYKLYELDNEVILDEKYKNVVTHTVLKGETLFAISRKYRISVKEIKRINNLENNTIKINQRLVIRPKSIDDLVDETIQVKTVEKVIKTESKKEIVTKTPVKLKTDDSKVDEKVTETVKPIAVINSSKEAVKINPNTGIEVTKQDDVSKTNPILNQNVEIIKEKENISYVKTAETKKAEAPNYHIVSQKETLYTIAYKYGLDVLELRKINRITKENVPIGTKLYLNWNTKNNGVSTQSSVEVLNSTNTYTVIKGDTLFKIATRNGMNVKQLKQLNNLTNNNIRIGQILKLN